jgi:photosystem II stability/assembly factor-like uncharacterized protein
VAVSSGGVWKTTNAGTTFEPIFNSQGSYSIGCITIDPNNPNIVWVGTGENNNQRSVAYGDGIYKTEDGGKSWTHMGLKNSEHIGRIIIHPDNSEIVYVAAIGPLWNKGGDRGVYKSMDGGKNWEAILTVDEHTGVNDIVMDPRNPDVIYAAAYQRARHVYTYLGGGPGSGIYKTTNGGKDWKKSNSGLPSVDIGRIGLAISPADPELIYAIVEAAQGEGGFYRSTDRAASWEKRGDYVTSGNYYQEIVADPKDPNKVYAMDTWMHYTTDGGKTFQKTGEQYKHVDNHSLWIDPDDTEHWIAGCDGGIYETFDNSKSWAYKPNLPITQFYKVSVDNSKPFYYIYGGTQDNNTLGGPSRTTSGHGILNQDWFITHGGDGFETQVDPLNPDIVYSQSQYGVLVRFDRKSGEELGIQPTERKDEAAYRWNWDAPLVVSAHAPGRLYFAANKVFRTNDQGNSWEVISDDLTRQLNRNQLRIMDQIWSIDAVAKNRSTSPYGTIVSLAESPINENLLYAGTDDGLIQVTQDGGNTWMKLGTIIGVPSQTYVNAIWASQHDENVVYAAFNHHKFGDFKPYIFKSMDKGLSWQSISNNLPERGSVYAIAEDHLDDKLLFVGTEFGVFYSADGGMEWTQLKNGVPTIAVRDLAIHKGESDLVLGTFGRGFYVLDDYSCLRGINLVQSANNPNLFPIRDPISFEYRYQIGYPGKGFQGDQFYVGENLGSEAIFSYYLPEKPKTRAENRRKKEKDNRKNNIDPVYPSYEAYKDEKDETKVKLIFTIRDIDSQVVRTIITEPKAGLNRIKWDLRYNSKEAVSIKKSSAFNPFDSKAKAPLVLPGSYTLELAMETNGEIEILDKPVKFKVRSLDNTTLPAKSPKVKKEFQAQIAELQRQMSSAQKVRADLISQLKYAEEAIKKVEAPSYELLSEIRSISKALKEIGRKMNGDEIATELDMNVPPSISNRLGFLIYEQTRTTSAVTRTHRESYRIAKEEFMQVASELTKLKEDKMKTLLDQLDQLKAPYTPGRSIQQ